MRKLARHLVYMLAMLSFVGVSTGTALAIHLNLHQVESGCCHDSHNHEHSDHDPSEKDEHDSPQCKTCQQLGMIAKRILVESPNLILELTVIKYGRVYTINQYSDSYKFSPLKPRAPPALSSSLV